MSDAIKKAYDELLLDLEAINYEAGFDDALRIPAAHKIERREKLRIHLADALKQLMENGGWRPISEAPRDGTKIDVLNHNGERTTDVWFEGGQWKHWWISDYDGMGTVRLDIAPTHFRLLPAPPPPLNNEREA